MYKQELIEKAVSKMQLRKSSLKKVFEKSSLKKANSSNKYMANGK